MFKSDKFFRTVNFKTLLLGFALVESACAGQNNAVLKDGLIGAGAGAVVGAIVPGISVGEGAAIGGAGGAVYGLVKDKNGRTVHKDEHGNKYWIDNDGKRHCY